ncbi:MAG: pseudouridine synthase [Candidatus Kapaibacterium sp.]
MKKRRFGRKIIEPDKQEVRLNKYIADSGLTSRRKADELIAKGVVKINGKKVTEMGARVHPGDLVTVNGNPVKEDKNNIYILLNKPKDHISTTDDELNRKTVLDIVKRKERLFPVGRLDRNTTGVLLLTNDGELTQRLTHPRYKIPRVYKVLLDKELQFNHAAEIAKGVELEDMITSPCEVFINPDDKSKVTITLIEGKNHEVKNIFAHFGYKVKQLDREIFASLTTKGMKRGQYRYLNRKEITKLRRIAGL